MSPTNYQLPTPAIRPAHVTTQAQLRREVWCRPKATAHSLVHPGLTSDLYQISLSCYPARELFTSTDNASHAITFLLCEQSQLVRCCVLLDSRAVIQKGIFLF